MPGSELGLTVALLIISWTAVFMRLGVRLFMIRSFGWDDGFLLSAQIIYTTSALLNVLRASNIDSEAALLSLFEFVLIAPILYIVENIFMRLSLGLFFLRFLVTAWQRRYVFVSISVYTLYALSYLIAIIVFFGDPHKLALKMLMGECRGSSCGSWPVIGPMSYVFAVNNTLIDLTFAALPVFFIRKANMPLRTKLSVCGLLGLGNISSIASIVRFPYIGDLNITSGVVPANTFIIATTIEQAAGITALAAAALRPLFALKLTKTTNGSTHPKSTFIGSQRTQGTVNVHEVTQITEAKASDQTKHGLGTMTTITAHDLDPEKGSNDYMSVAGDQLSGEFRL